MIFIKYYNNNSVYKINNLFKPSNIKYISLQELQKVSVKKNNILILSTNSGIITNSEAVKKQLGGILLFQLYL